MRSAPCGASVLQVRGRNSLPRRKVSPDGSFSSSLRAACSCAGFSRTVASGTWCARKVPSMGSPSTSFGPVQPFGERRMIIGHSGTLIGAALARRFAESREFRRSRCPERRRISGASTAGRRLRRSRACIRGRDRAASSSVVLGASFDRGAGNLVAVQMQGSGGRRRRARDSGSGSISSFLRAGRFPLRRRRSRTRRSDPDYRTRLRRRAAAHSRVLRLREWNWANAGRSGWARRREWRIRERSAGCPQYPA